MGVCHLMYPVCVGYVVSKGGWCLARVPCDGGCGCGCGCSCSCSGCAGQSELRMYKRDGATLLLENRKTRFFLFSGWAGMCSPSLFHTPFPFHLPSFLWLGDVRDEGGVGGSANGDSHALSLADWQAGWLAQRGRSMAVLFLHCLPDASSHLFDPPHPFFIPPPSTHPSKSSKKKSTEEEQLTMSPNDHTYDEIIAKIVSCSTDLTAVTKTLGPYLNNLQENIFLARAHGQSDPLDALSPENHSFAYLYFL
ncbi:MAG: hypothetical protein BYD32DRAFT_266161 [Podila humilis]|nr:MAG: hypothetical protein BYD32DRAFT_266161 [Podila humilis]